MLNITDGNNNISRHKPVEHIDVVIGLHVSACTSYTRTMCVRRDIAIDITELVQLLVRFNALRSMPVMPKLEHYNVDAMRSKAAAALARRKATHAHVAPIYSRCNAPYIIHGVCKNHHNGSGAARHHQAHHHGPGCGQRWGGCIL